MGTKSAIESSPTKPPSCKVCIESIPQELKDRSHWVCWTYKRRKQRWTKVPYQPKKGPAAADNPGTWSDFEAVGSYVSPVGDMRGKIFSGIGYEFSAEDPFCGIDLDDAIDAATGKLKLWAQTIIDRLNSYTEISPSGTGVKIWIKARKPSNARSRTKHEDGEVEIYDRGRYFAVTGQRWPGTPATIEERQAELDALYQHLFSNPDDKKSPSKRMSAVQPEARPLADAELIEKAKAATNGDKFTRLMAGDTSDFDGDASRADAALCATLAFWTGKNTSQMDRIFRSSGLIRPKWDERRGDKTYGEQTIEAACQLVHETYRGNRRRSRRGDFSTNGNGHADGDGKRQESDIFLNEADDDPHRLAQGFLHRHSIEETLTLRYWCDEFLRWDGRVYRSVADQEIRAEATQYVRRDFERLYRESRLAEMRNGPSVNDNDKTPPPVRKVTVKLLGDVLQALRGITCLPFDVKPPAWLNGPEPFAAAESLVCSNGILHLPDWVDRGGGLHPLTPRLFTPAALDYSFDPEAATPKNWLHFLNLLWPDDPQTIAALQEWFGYCLLPDTSQQKILMLVGPKRSGKGTIARILSGLIGPHNTAAPTLGSMGASFGLQPLLHKTLAIISDARLSHRTDAAVVVERLLSISGEDSQTVDRKFREPLTLRLPLRFMILTNELPRLHDPSGALVGRLILLRMTKSFYGREDTKLTTTILRELPGILLWAIEGWKRLRQRGRFQLPDSSVNILQQMDDLASPVAAFVRERCRIDLGFQVPCSHLFEAWRDWSDAKGVRPGSEQSFGRDLRAVVPCLDTQQPRCGVTRFRVYTGIGLREEGNEQVVKTPWG